MPLFSTIEPNSGQVILTILANEKLRQYQAGIKASLSDVLEYDPKRCALRIWEWLVCFTNHKQYIFTYNEKFIKAD
jgi:hypothetical protein